MRTFAVKWVGLAVLAICAPAIRAELRCDEATFDAGEVKAGQPLSHRFTFVNVGNMPIAIAKVQPSCGCLKPRLSEERLRPGASAVLVLEVNSLTQPAGPNAWRVQLFYTEAGEARDLTLILRAKLITEIRLQPAALLFHTSTSLGHDVTLVDVRPHPLQITGVRTTSPLLRAERRKPSTNEAGHWIETVHIEVLTGYPVGRNDEMLLLTTSDADYAELRVPVTIVKEARAAVSATPAELTLVAPTSEPLPAKIIRLRAGEGSAVVVERVACDSQAVTCSWAQGPGEMATLKVRIDTAKAPATGLRTSISVQLTEPMGATVCIPVTWNPR